MDAASERQVFLIFLSDGAPSDTGFSRPDLEDRCVESMEGIGSLLGRDRVNAGRPLTLRRDIAESNAESSDASERGSGWIRQGQDWAIYPSTKCFARMVFDPSSDSLVQGDFYSTHIDMDDIFQQHNDGTRRHYKVLRAWRGAAEAELQRGCGAGCVPQRDTD